MNMIIATHNAHKIEEFGRILAPLGITVQTAELTEAEETGTTFRENAYIKAKSACDETGLPCVADDSGLSIDYLNGEPGVYSARYARDRASVRQRYSKSSRACRKKSAARTLQVPSAVYSRTATYLKPKATATGASQRNAAAKAVSVMTPFSSAPKKAARARRSAKRRQKKRMP